MISLRTKLWIVFLVMLTASQAAALLGVWPALRDVTPGPTGPAPETAMHDHLVRRLAVAGVVALVIGGVLTAAVARSMTRPMAVIGRRTQQMVEGRLDRLIPTDSGDRETAHVGEHINDLAMNLQESLLFVWKRTDGALARYEAIRRHISRCGDPELAALLTAEIDDAGREIEEIRTLVRSFRFYDVDLDDTVILSRETPGNRSG